MKGDLAAATLPEDNIPWEAVTRQVAAVNKRMIILDASQGFDAAQRRQILEELVADLTKQRIQLPPSDVKRFVEVAAAKILTLYLEGYTTLVGVPKKGLSILRDMAQNLNLSGSVFSSRKVTQDQVKGQKLVVFDDTIHKGKEIVRVLKRLLAFQPDKVAVVVMWASMDGVAAFNKALDEEDQKKITFVALDQVPEGIFWLVFQLYTSPVLYSLRGGAISNRPVDEMRVTPKDGSMKSAQVAKEILEAAANVPLVDAVVANSPLDGIPWETFHGEMEIAEAEIARLSKELGDLATGIEYAKVRMFIHPSQPFHVYLVGCLCAEGFAPGATSIETVDKLDSEWSGKMMDRVAKEFQVELEKRGLTATCKRVEMG